MSAIAGVFAPNHPAAERLVPSVEKMLQFQSHRGGDYVSSASASGIALGFAALNTTREALKEKQPIVDLATQCQLVGDVRIDNRHELAGKLNVRESQFGDAGLVLYAYLKWGRDCVDHLLGDFAFAVWDPRRSHLYIARDHFGVRSVVYSKESGRFLFATEVGAILCARNQKPPVSRERLIDFHIDELEGASPETTFFEEIYRVPAGHFMIVDHNHSLIMKRYWRLDVQDQLRLKSDGEYLEAFDDLLRIAIECRCRTVGDFGAMLSGGLDSSSVVAVINDICDAKNKSFVSVYSGVNEKKQVKDDTYYIKLIADALGIEPHYVDPQSGVSSLQTTLSDPDSLFDISMVMPRMIYHAAAAKGQRVVLDGLFGDEILESHFSGVWKSTVLDRDNSLRELRKSYNNLIRANTNDNLIFPFLLCVARRYVPRKLGSWVGLLRVLGKQNAELNNIAIQFSLKEKFLLAKRRRAVTKFNGLGHSYRAKKTAFFSHAFTAVALERYDRVAGRQSVECRHPLIDKRLVEFCMSLPIEQTLRNGHSRWVLRKSMEKLLPSEAVWREKGVHLGLQFGLVDPLPPIDERWAKSPPSLYRKDKYCDIVFSDNDRSVDTNIEADLAYRKLVALSHWLTIHDSL